MIADLPKNREIGAGWSGLFVLHFLLSRRITENWPALFSFSYGMPVDQIEERPIDFQTVPITRSWRRSTRYQQGL
jgi:hypothetical protein